MAELMAVTDATFEAEVLQAQVPTLVDFWAEWCGPCRMMAPILEKLAAAHAGKLKVVKFDVQESPDTPASLGIMNIPTMILYVGGEEKERLIGYVPQRKIEKACKPYLG